LAANPAERIDYLAGQPDHPGFESGKEANGARSDD
jgi:hypothetical protein